MYYPGKEIGAGHLEEARRDGSRVLRLAVVTGIPVGILILILSPAVLHYAALSEQALAYLKKMLFINSYYVIGIVVNFTLTAGIFRAGGDSRFGLLCDTFNMWGYAVPFGFLTAFVFHWPPMVVYFFLCTDKFTKMPWAIRRYRSGRWLKNITRKNPV